MQQKTMMITAIAVVAIVIVAGAAVLLVKNDNDNNKKDSGTDIGETVLQIRGNADNDYKLDSGDLSIVQDVKDGKKSLSDYPLADVNNDGKVDQTDIDLPYVTSSLNTTRTRTPFDLSFGHIFLIIHR